MNNILHEKKGTILSNIILDIMSKKIIFNLI